MNPVTIIAFLAELLTKMPELIKDVEALIATIKGNAPAAAVGSTGVEVRADMDPLNQKLKDMP